MNKLSKTIILFIFLIPHISVVADIEPRAYKDIYYKIDEKFSHVNPLWGQLALDSGILYNLRFYGNYIRGEENGERIYRLDGKSKDPMWNLIKELFPSVTGSLGTTAAADNNFGRYVNNPKTIARLLQYGDNVRNHLNDTRVTDDIYNTLSNDKKKQVKKTIDLIVKHMEAAIESEGDNQFYPRYFTETVVLGFFAKKFNNQTDIWNLLRDLNSLFGQTIAKDIPEQEDLLTNKDIPKLAERIGTPSLNAENVFSILNADIFLADNFLRIIPYRETQPLIENETICAYMRTSKSFDPKSQFADCAETALRHVLNLLLYNSSTNSFTLPIIQEDKQSESYKHLVEFYAVQTPERVNDSSKQIRELWNKVVADLNAVDEPTTSSVRYVKPYNNETDTGYINMVRILQKIFNIAISPLPTKKEEWPSWLETALLKIFVFINPAHNYDFKHNLRIQTIKVGQKEYEDLFGTVIATIKDKNTEKYTFTIEQTQIHAKVVNLKTLDSTTQLHITDLDSYKKLLAQNPVKLLPYQESLVVVGQQKTLVHPYDIFGGRLDTNTARLSWLKKLEHGDITINHPQYLDHVLKAMSWDDIQTMNSLQPILEGLILKDIFKDIVMDRVEALVLKNTLDFAMRKLTLFNNIKRVNIDNVKTISQSDLPPKLRHLTVSDVDQLYLEDNESLEYLELLQNGSKQLRLKNIGKLQKIDIAENTKIEHIDIDGLPGLETISARHSNELKMVTLYHLPNLKRADFSNCTKMNVISFHDLPEIEELGLENTSQLDRISIHDLPKITKIFLNYTGAKDLDLKNLPSLETLHLDATSRLVTVTLNDFPRLNQATFSFSKIKSVVLENLPLLTEVNFDDSFVNDITLKNLDKLENFNIRRFKGISFKKIMLVDLPNFKSINASRSPEITNDKIEINNVPNGAELKK